MGDANKNKRREKLKLQRTRVADKRIGLYAQNNGQVSDTIDVEKPTEYELEGINLNRYKPCKQAACVTLMI